MEHVDFGYGEKKVLEDLTLTFEKGKKYALTGPGVLLVQGAGALVYQEDGPVVDQRPGNGHPLAL